MAFFEEQNSMDLSLKKKSAAIAMLTAAVSIGITNGAVFADSTGQHDEQSQMNHEQMMNSDEEQMQMQECSDDSGAEMNREQMMKDGEQMSMEQCSDDSNMQMNHEQMMKDGEQMPMSDDVPSSPE